MSCLVVFFFVTFEIVVVAYYYYYEFPVEEFFYKKDYSTTVRVSMSYGAKRPAERCEGIELNWIGGGLIHVECLFANGILLRLPKGLTR